MPRAVDLAVKAHIRHAHTNYDELLMRGTERLDARALVREKIRPCAGEVVRRVNHQDLA